MYNYSSTIWIRKNNVMHVEFYTLDALSREYCITLNTQDPCKSKGFICILSLPIAFLSFNPYTIMKGDILMSFILIPHGHGYLYAASIMLEWSVPITTMHIYGALCIKLIYLRSEHLWQAMKALHLFFFQNLICG